MIETHRVACVLYQPGIHRILGFRYPRDMKAALVKVGDTTWVNLRTAADLLKKTQRDCIASVEQAKLRIARVDPLKLPSIDNMSLAAVWGELVDLELMTQETGHKPRIQWKMGLEHPNYLVRERFRAICRRLLAEVAMHKGVPPRYLFNHHFQKGAAVVIPELEVTLSGLYSYFDNRPKTDETQEEDTVTTMLRELEVVPSNLDIEQEVALLGTLSRIPWQRVPLPVQRFIVAQVALAAGKSPWHLVVDDFRHTRLPGNDLPLIQLYQHYQRRRDRAGSNALDFMLTQMEFPPSPFNAVGRLHTIGEIAHPTQSLHLTLDAVRRAVRIWREKNPEKPLTEIRCGGLIDIVNASDSFAGIKTLFAGPSSNPFGLNFLELICLALEYVPLDGADPQYRILHPGGPNTLRPSVFHAYGRSRNGRRALPPVTGTYTYRAPEGLLGLLGQVLAAAMKLPRETGNGAETKWLETQAAALGNIRARIESGRSLPDPLAFALGRQRDRTVLAPQLANAELISGWGLDPAQAAAARIILAPNPLVVIHGPFGSGKTHLVTPVVEWLVRKGKKVLYAAPTHKAADVFLERLVGYESETLFIRLGATKEGLSSCAETYWVGDKAARSHFREMRLRQRHGALFIGTIAGGVHFLQNGDSRSQSGEMLSFWQDRRMQATERLTEYDVVIIDEASMVPPAEAYTLLACAQQAVMIGDHIQFGPFPLDQRIKAALGLSARQLHTAERSLLEELLLGGYPHVLLDQNYRAVNPALLALASRIFYDERVRMNPASPYFRLSAEERARRFPPESLKLIDTSKQSLGVKQEERERGGTSYLNRHEVQVVLSEVRALLQKGYRAEDITIITPYDAQQKLLQSSLASAFPAAFFKVSTFRGVQGDESKCVLISFVRSNEKKPPETGFLGDYHQVNVGLTRASEVMVLVGDWETLKKTGTQDGTAPILTDPFDQQTRYIFAEIERVIGELANEGLAQIVR